MGDLQVSFQANKLPPERRSLRQHSAKLIKINPLAILCNLFGMVNVTPFTWLLVTSNQGAKHVKTESPGAKRVLFNKNPPGHGC